MGGSFLCMYPCAGAISMHLASDYIHSYKDAGGRAARCRVRIYLPDDVHPTFRTPFYVFENFRLNTHTEDDLPAKQGYLSCRIFDFARMEVQQGNRNHPSMRRSFSKERFSKYAMIAKIQP